MAVWRLGLGRPWCWNAASGCAGLQPLWVESGVVGVDAASWAIMRSGTGAAGAKGAPSRTCRTRAGTKESGRPVNRCSTFSLNVITVAPAAPEARPCHTTLFSRGTCYPPWAGTVLSAPPVGERYAVAASDDPLRSGLRTRTGRRAVSKSACRGDLSRRGMHRRDALARGAVRCRVARGSARPCRSRQPHVSDQP
jgi:hypothetical protein